MTARPYGNTYDRTTKEALIKRLSDRADLMSKLDTICEKIPHEAKLNDLTYAYIKHVYERLEHNKVQTARALGICLRAVRYYFNNHPERLENKKR